MLSIRQGQKEKTAFRKGYYEAMIYMYLVFDDLTQF